MIEIIDGKPVVMGYMPTTREGMGKTASTANFQGLGAGLRGAGGQGGTNSQASNTAASTTAAGQTSSQKK
jgi:hypothetical protein